MNSHDYVWVTDLMHNDDRTKGQRLVDNWFPIAFWLGVFGTLLAVVLLQAVGASDWSYWILTAWAVAASVGLAGLITEGLIDSYISRLGEKIKELENE